jgi:hypothetical protein
VPIHAAWYLRIPNESMALFRSYGSTEILMKPWEGIAQLFSIFFRISQPAIKSENGTFEEAVANSLKHNTYKQS